MLLLTACSTAEERRQKALMDQIEHELRLPTGAHPLSKYARYYAFADGGVHAVYIIPWDAKAMPAEDDGCEERTARRSTASIAKSRSIHSEQANDAGWLNDGTFPLSLKEGATWLS
jgi:hypothetical protein